MKILLVKLEDPDTYQLYPPYGLMLASSSLNSKGHDTEIFHERATKENLEILYHKAKGSSMVGFSVMTSPSIIYTLEASKRMHDLGIPVVWGGIHPTILPYTTLKDKFIDYIVIGEGEETILELAEHVEGKRDIKNMRGIGYRDKNNEIVVRKKEFFIKDLNKYLLSWREVDINRYFQKKYGFKKVLPFLTSRGCPHRCGFCYNQSVHKRSWRGQDVDFVVNEVDKLADFGVEGLVFYDDNFFTNKKRAFSVLEKIGYPWFAEVRADYVNDEFLKKAKALKCQEIFIGAERGSNEMLKVIQKDLTVEQIEDAVKKSQKYGIRNTLSFIIGFPGEQTRDMEKTLDFMYKLHKKYEGITIDGPKIYTPYPGTPLYEVAKEHGFKEPSTSMEWATKFFRNRCELPWIDEGLRERMELLFYMVYLVQIKKNLMTVLPRTIEDFRWRNNFLAFPIELKIAKMMANQRLGLEIFNKFLKVTN